MADNQQQEREQQQQQNSADSNPFKYLYRMQYINPTLPKIPIGQNELLPTLLNTNEDFFSKKFDKYVQKANEHSLSKTKNNFSTSNFFSKTSLMESQLLKSQSHAKLKNLKQVKIEAGSQTQRDSMKSKTDDNNLTLNLQKLNVSTKNQTQQDFYQTWRGTGGSGFKTQRSQSLVKIEALSNKTYKDWKQAEQQLQNNKQFHDQIVQDMTEFQTQAFNSTLKEFNTYVNKVQGMPVIRISKKKESKDDDDKLQGSEFGFKNKNANNSQKGQQSKQIFYSSVLNSELKLYWEKIPAMKWSPDPREGSTMTCVGNKIFIFGGLSSKLNKDVEILNTQTWRWIKPQEFKVKHQPTPRYNHSAVQYFDHIIIFGGQQTYNQQTKIRNTMNDLLLFNTQTFEWEQIHYGGMFFHRKLHVAAIVAHHMILYGGLNEEGHFESGLLALNLGTFKWMPCPTTGDEPGQLIYQGCCSIIHPDRSSKKSFSLFKNPSDMKYRQFSRIKHEGVYFFGGRRPDGFAQNSLHVLRVGCKPLQWLQPECKGQPPSPRYGHTMNYFEPMNSIVLFGGRNDTLMEKKMKLNENFLNDLWLLNLESMSWINVIGIGETPTARYSFCSAIYGSRLVIFGGLNSQTYNSSDLYICELDPMLSKQYEAEKNRKILEFKKELARNKYGSEEAQSQTAQILQKFFGHRLKNKKIPLPLNLITYLENRHQAIEKQKEEERRQRSIKKSMELASMNSNLNSGAQSRKASGSNRIKEEKLIDSLDDDSIDTFNHL